MGLSSLRKAPKFLLNFLGHLSPVEKNRFKERKNLQSKRLDWVGGGARENQPKKSGTRILRTSRNSPLKACSDFYFYDRGPGQDGFEIKGEQKRVSPNFCMARSKTPG